MFIYIIKVLVGFIILNLAGTNLIGLVVRSLVIYRQLKNEENQGDVLREFIQTNNRSVLGTFILYCILTILYFLGLYHYWNSGVVIAAGMIMFSRLPDLLYEIRTGEKITLKEMPNAPIYILFNLISWAALPVLWFSLR